MDWARAIERNSEALEGIIEALFAMLGLASDATVSRIPQPLHRAVLRVLRPAESAMRRLIVIAARGLVVKAGTLAAHADGAQDRKGQHASPLLPALRSTETFQARAGHEIHPACPAHPFLRNRSPGGSPVASAPACGRTPAAARWPC